MKTLSLTLAFLTTVSLASAGEVKFSTKPSTAREKDKVKIAFAVSGKTDVEVTVLNKAGKVARHLAAGVLGAEKPPPAPLKKGFAQSLEWDMRDDIGKPAKGGPFKVRVRIGTRPTFGAALGAPDALGSNVYGLATDEQGELYVATGGGYGPGIFSIKVFNRKGEYLRTIFPYPANLKAADVNGFGKQKLRDGKLSPPQFNALLPWIHPSGLGGFMSNTVREGVLWLTNGRGQLCRIRSKDGACISWGGTKAPAPPSGGSICWAATADGATLYLAGWRQWRRKWSAQQKSKADGQIYKVDPATGERKPFISIDVPEKSFWLTEINGWYNFKNWGRKNGLSAFHGMAVDAQGRIYVCDRVNQRIGVYDKSGKYLGGTKVEWPDHVALSPKGEELYVTTRRIVNGYKGVNEIKVVKLSGWKDGKVLAELTLPGKNAPSVAVDATAEPAVIWLSNVGEGKIDKSGRNMKTGGVTRIEDRGGKLVVSGKLGGEPVLPEAVVKVWADPFSDDIVVSNGWSGLTRLDGLTGKKKPFPLRGMELCFGPDRNIYVYGQKGWHELVTRFDRSFKPAPFTATGKNTTTMDSRGKDVYGRFGHGWCNKGLHVSPRGRIYVYNMYGWAKYFVNVWDASGKAEKHDRVGAGIVGPIDAQGGGLRVDAAGNIYVGLHGAPAGSTAASDRRRTKGAIVKFPPGGGGYVKAAKGGNNAAKGIAWTGSHVGNFVEKGMRAYPILAPQVSRGCVCKEARFDLDGWGRLYIPNGLDYYVTMVDNAGNRIARFGYYANGDSRGGESAVPDPKIPLGWPISVSAAQVDKKRIYVADTLNRRVIRVELEFAAEETCAVK
jgi:DNA-binding beta-propeller fold protein YncE